MPNDENATAVRYALRDRVAYVCLARSAKRNAINDQVIADLAIAVERARSEARVAILYGEGEHFSAGLDLLELADREPLQGMLASQRWHEVFERIEFSPVPWIAALHGAVVGGGLELAAAAHIRVADETAFFGLPEGQRGIFVGGGGAVRVSRLIGVSRMTDMMLTGRTVTSEQGEAWGLVQYVVPEGRALDEASKLASSIASNSALSNRFITNALPRIGQIDQGTGLFMESVVAAFVASSPEAADRLRDFREKRAAKVQPPGS